MQYEDATYYVDEWESSYNEWVTMVNNIYYGSQRHSYLLSQARVVDMVLTQPIVYDLDLIYPRTLLIIGDKGKCWTSNISMNVPYRT